MYRTVFNIEKLRLEQNECGLGGEVAVASVDVLRKHPVSRNSLVCIPSQPKYGCERKELKKKQSVYTLTKCENGERVW